MTRRSIFSVAILIAVHGCGGGRTGARTPDAGPVPSGAHAPGHAANGVEAPLAPSAPARATRVDRNAIARAAGVDATTQPDGVVRIQWARDDVPVTVDGAPFAPAAGLGSWAAFTGTPNGAMVMGDTVLFEDEVTPAMDAAFAHDLEVTGLHNHFFFDSPHVYFMHIGGMGEPAVLAASVKAVWDAAKGVRRARPRPASRFGGPAPRAGTIDAAAIERALGRAPTVQGGVVKVVWPRDGQMHGTAIGGSMGLTTWAAFSGSDALASADGDFIMTHNEVQRVLRALRAGGLHVVALHNHMIGEEPAFYFTHFWGTGPVSDLARAVHGALDAQAAAPRPRL